FVDRMVQPPTLTGPSRGSLAGQYATTAFGPADVSRGSFSLVSVLSAPTDRGPLLGASPFPTYSTESGISEWGMGWQANLGIIRTRPAGDLDYENDELAGPWGRMVLGTDTKWYPLGLQQLVRMEASGPGFIAYTADGSVWTFGATERIEISG